jgi:O-antigen/teichoic acid export membrane protein
MGPTHILLLAMDTALTPSASRAFAVGGSAGLRSFIVRIITLTAPIMMAYCLFIGLFARPILTLLYGTQYSQYSWLLMLFALNYALLYLRSPAVIALEAQRASAPIFRAHLWSGLVVLTVGVAAVHLFGLLGAALGTVANALILNLILWQRYRRIVVGNTVAPGLVRHGVAADDVSEGCLAG